MRLVKRSFPFVIITGAAITLVLSGCNTIENRRSLYSPKKADGPYTRALEDGSWKRQKTVDEQYSEAARKKKWQLKTPDQPSAPQATAQ